MGDKCVSTLTTLGWGTKEKEGEGKTILIFSIILWTQNGYLSVENLKNAYLNNPRRTN
jgi:hypothetical protein